MSSCLTRGFVGLAALAACVGMARAEPEVAVNRFACSLYHELAKDNENLFFSPLSVSTALAMTAEGARGETAREMGEALGLENALRRDDAQRPYDWSPLHTGLAQLADHLAPRPTPPERLAKLETLSAELEQANHALESATSFGKDYYDLGQKAKRLADDINRLQRQIDPTVFRSANALWLDRSFTLEPPYLETIGRHYKTDGVMPVDFRSDPEASRKAINDWVETQTEQRIRNLLAPGMVSAATRLVLTNAVYFLGEWLEPFEPASTRTENFLLRDGGSLDVPLMHALKREGVKYAAFNADGSAFETPLRVSAQDDDTAGRYPEGGFQLLELPYRGDALSMQVLLPLRPDDLAELEALLSAENLARWNAALEARKVDVALPKFKLEASAELSRVLQQLGMKRAFVNPVEPEGAQFDGISAGSDPTQRLYIGAVVHKAFVQVDEKGTEAAAATAVIMPAGAAMPMMVDFIPEFRADHPFVFLIRDQRSGTVLFLGRLARPTSG